MSLEISDCEQVKCRRARPRPYAIHVALRRWPQIAQRTLISLMSDLSLMHGVHGGHFAKQTHRNFGLDPVDVDVYRLTIRH